MVRDALPAAEEIMRIQIKPKTPEPLSEPLSEPTPLPQPVKSEPEILVEEKPSIIANGSVGVPEFSEIFEENKRLKDENAEMSAEIRSAGSKIARIQDDLDSKNRELKRLSRQVDQLEG